MKRVVADGSSGCRIAHRLCDSAVALVMCWRLTTRIETDMAEQASSMVNAESGCHESRSSIAA